MKFFMLAGILLTFCWLTPARADSPLTSVRFAEVYGELGVVAAADARGVLDAKIAAFLSDPRMPIDAKAAVCNALGWSIDGKHNAVLFRCWLALQYGVAPEQLTLEQLTGDEVFALGYLTALDDYFQPIPALALLRAAGRRNPQSQTVVLVTALVESQLDMQENRREQIWPRTDRILRDTTLRQDLRPAMVTAFVDYLLLYRPDAASDTVAPDGK